MHGATHSLALGADLPRWPLGTGQLATGNLLRSVINLLAKVAVLLVQAALAGMVADEAFEAALDVAGEANPDVRKRELLGAFPPAQVVTLNSVPAQQAL